MAERNPKRFTSLIHKYNEQEYIHWDDLRHKKIPYDPITILVCDTDDAEHQVSGNSHR